MTEFVGPGGSSARHQLPISVGKGTGVDVGVAAGEEAGLAESAAEAVGDVLGDVVGETDGVALAVALGVELALAVGLGWLMQWDPLPGPLLRPGLPDRRAGCLRPPRPLRRSSQQYAQNASPATCVPSSPEVRGVGQIAETSASRSIRVKAAC